MPAAIWTQFGVRQTASFLLGGREGTVVGTGAGADGAGAGARSGAAWRLATSAPKRPAKTAVHTAPRSQPWPSPARHERRSTKAIASSARSGTAQLCVHALASAPKVESGPFDASAELQERCFGSPCSSSRSSRGADSASVDALGSGMAAQCQAQTRESQLGIGVTRALRVGPLLCVSRV